MTAELAAPAKLTLSLRVLGVRDDGFHVLDALTVSVDAPCDTLTIEPGPPGVRLSVRGPASAGVPGDADNLVAHAALAVLPDDEGLEIGLHKEIPPGSGLGGGSSDAAAALRFCAERYALDPEIVAEAAAAVGSDIPFCVQQRPAWMRVAARSSTPSRSPTRSTSSSSCRRSRSARPRCTGRGTSWVARAAPGRSRPPVRSRTSSTSSRTISSRRRNGSSRGSWPSATRSRRPRGRGRCWRGAGRRAGSRSRTRPSGAPPRAGSRPRSGSPRTSG